jgi:AcrR family transcriptional regulator
MGRVVKLAEVRKEELVDCAEALFLSKGYEETTVADIMARAQVSKGGFYHHFASKEELLDALIERMTATLVANARDVLDNENLDALTKLNRFLIRSQQWKVKALPEMRGLSSALFNPDNAQLYLRMARAAVAALRPVLTALVKQGVRERIFDVPDPDIVAELIVLMSNARYAVFTEAMAIADKGDLAGAAKHLEHRMRKEEAVIERVLGVKPGTIRLVEPGTLKKMLAAMR